jgi:hypothetical protein
MTRRADQQKKCQKEKPQTTVIGKATRDNATSENAEDRQSGILSPMDISQWQSYIHPSFESSSSTST